MPKKVRLSQTASDHLLAKMYAKGWTEVDLSNKTGLDPRTIGSAIAGKNVNLSTIFRIEEALGIDPSQLIQMDNSREEAALSVTTGKNSIFEKWHPLFCNVLQSRLNLSSNTFTSFDGLCFERRDVYVPLALYKRSSQLNYKESLAEILNTFLAGGEIKTRMVFCGLPGSGKTTQLQAIADAVSNHPYCGFVIWISPENFLKAPTHLDPLTELLYLLPGHSNLSDTDRGELRTLFSQSLVCLILDDVGEIETRDSRDNQDLQDYFNRLNQRVLKLSSIAHFVMSCRTAVWDDMGNCLRESFDTYDMVGFSIGEGKDLGQLGQGIDKLFPVKVAKHLRESLEFYPHFKFLLSLPLHLISLRYAWHLCGDSDELSILSAELHSKFVDRLCDRCRIPEDERLHISHNAGDLAHFAIERSRRSLQFSKKAIYEDSWKGRARLNSFDELIEVGILRKFGMSYRTPNEEIYVFFYPFLQMYFAAAAVFFMSWLFFFNPNPEDPEKKSFRAQELPWWEAILIWLSRKDVEDTYKEALLNALMDFEDECGGFYYFRSYCLIAAAIQQYPSFSRGH